MRSYLVVLDSLKAGTSSDLDNVNPCSAAGTYNRGFYDSGTYLRSKKRDDSPDQGGKCIITNKLTNMV